MAEPRGDAVPVVLRAILEPRIGRRRMKALAPNMGRQGLVAIRCGALH